MKRVVISVLVFAAVLISIAYGRTWTDQKGRHITADYVSLLQLDEPKVKLMKPNGEYILVPVKALSKEDQDYIQGLNGNNPVKASTDNDNDDDSQGSRPKDTSESVVYPAMKNLDIGSREAYEALIQLRDSDPSKLEPDYTLALLFIFKNKNYLEAQKHLSRCQKISPDNMGVLLNLGTLSILQGKYPEAYSYYQKVYTLGGANNTLNQNLHKLIEESGSHNIFLPVAVRNKFIELSGNVSQKVKTKYNPKQGWMFEKCSEGISEESHKCLWFKLKGYRPYEFPVCPKCNGTGNAECPNKNCSGGKIPIMVNKTTRVPNGRSVTMQVREYKTCDVCKGKNHVSCPVCKGSGLEFRLSKGEIEEYERQVREAERLAILEKEVEENRIKREKEAKRQQILNSIEEEERAAQRAKEEKEREIEEKRLQAQRELEAKIREEKRLQAIKNRTIVVGDLVVSVVNVKIDYVQIQSEITGRINVSSEPYLILDVSVSNRSTTKKIDFDSWAGDRLNMGSKARLQDEYDNTYKRIVFGAGTLIAGNKPNHSIYPEIFVTDRLVFETPIKTAKKLTLILPGDNIGTSGDIKIEFDTTDIQK